MIAAVGLRREARLAADRVVTAITGGGDSRKLADALDAGVKAGASGIISFGVAGGVAPHLEPGAVVVARGVLTEDGTRVETDTTWRASLIARLGGAIEDDLLGVDHVAAEAAAKAAFHRLTGAAALDMESHVAAAVAKRHDVPFAVVRVVADAASRTLPHAAVVGMGSDGRIEFAAVLRSLARSPHQLPGLIRIAKDSAVAFAALGRVRALLGQGFGLLDLGELALDVPRKDELRWALPI
ncbi:MAG: phosphorylase [Methylobacteriaceae bacterium]|nr:phosphorylase [Methylobacteriaceae bacterium]